MHLDGRLTCAKHIETKRKQLNLKAKKMRWILGRSSTVQIGSKLLLYKAVLKTHMDLWNSAMGDSL
jgi:hypothetical protein